MVDQIQGMGPMLGPGRQHRSAPLTDAQKTQIQQILSEYDPANVSTTDAKAIFQSFRDAGIKPTRGMKEVIEAAGFDADDLREKGRPQDAQSAAAGSAGRSKINLSSLKSLQDILSQFDLTNLSTDNTTSLLSKLQDKGFLNPGSMIDLKS
ncbi:MAG: hypothetical protein NTW32_25275 [Chloroflexi bacterium]|nr:hypothetical protein [Chloroflexota bacterium]